MGLKMRYEQQSDKVILTPDEGEEIKQVILYLADCVRVNLDRLGRLHITILECE